LQQKRVGGEVTLPTALSYYHQIINSDIDYHFLDHEAFFLHRENYIRYVGRILNFPITVEGINTFIDKDANHKYVNYVNEYWLDETIRNGRKPFKQR